MSKRSTAELENSVLGMDRGHRRRGNAGKAVRRLGGRAGVPGRRSLATAQGPVADVPPDIAAQRKALSQNPQRLVTGREREDLINRMGEIPPYTNNSPYGPLEGDPKRLWHNRIPADIAMPAWNNAMRPVPHSKESPERQGAIVGMRDEMIGHRFNPRYTDRLSGPSPQEIEWIQRLKARLNRRGIKGDVTLDGRESTDGPWIAVGPRGKRYRVPQMLPGMV